MFIDEDGERFDNTKKDELQRICGGSNNKKQPLKITKGVITIYIYIYVCMYMYMYIYI